MIFFKRSFGSEMLDAGGAPAGFDYLRIGLSLAVLVFHSVVSSYGDDTWLWQWPFGGVSSAIVPIFFCLSGFLVSGSYLRAQNLRAFLAARLFRLLPALTVDTIFSAVVIGGLLTALPLRDYFTSHGFYLYFLNIIGEIHFYLPGVFEQNPFHRVNQSLWTLPSELKCYALITILIVLRILIRPRLTFCLSIATIAAFVIYQIFVPNIAFRAETRLLLLSFLFGAAAYGMRMKIPSSIWLAGLSAIATYLLLSMRNPLTFLAPLPITYLTCWLGTRNPRKSVVISHGDYSYGIYLYAFPFQQIYVHFAAHPVWYLNVAFSVPMTVLFAMFSWRFIERPFLKLRQSAIIAKLVGSGLRKSPHANQLAEEPLVPPAAETTSPATR